MALYDEVEQDPWEARPYRIILLNVVIKQNSFHEGHGEMFNIQQLSSLNFFLEKHVIQSSLLLTSHILI